mgnify:CR=1 FL=1
MLGSVRYLIVLPGSSETVSGSGIRSGTAYHDLADYAGHVARLGRGEASKLEFPRDGR